MPLWKEKLLDVILILDLLRLACGLTVDGPRECV